MQKSFPLSSQLCTHTLTACDFSRLISFSLHISSTPFGSNDEICRIFRVANAQRGEEGNTMEATQVRLRVLSVQLHMLMLTNCCHRERDWNRWMQHTICCCCCNTGREARHLDPFLSLLAAQPKSSTNCFNFYSVSLS